MSITARRGFGVVLGLSAAAFGLAACGSFSSNDAPGTSEAGADAGPGGPDGGDGARGSEAAACDPSLLTHDPANCGRCGHSCLGGACANGTCQPVQIGTSVGEAVVDVAVDAQRVLWLTSQGGGFWSNAGHLYACPRAGCAGAGPASLTGNPVSTGSLGSDGTHAYFGEAYGPGGLFALPVSGGGVQPIGGAHSEVVRVQVRNGSVYFATLYQPGAAPGGFRGEVRRWDGMVDTSVAQFDGITNYSDVVVTGDRVFLASQYTVVTCKVGSCEALSPFSDANPSTQYYASFTTDGASLLWGDGTRVVSCPIDAAPCTTPVSVLGPASLGGATPREVTYDHGHLYVATSADDLFSCALPDCSGTLELVAHEARLFDGNDYLFGHAVAADDTAVYWSSVDGADVPDPDGGVDRSALVHRLMKRAK